MPAFPGTGPFLMGTGGAAQAMPVFLSTLRYNSSMMPLDKELYRRVYALRRQWFEAEQEAHRRLASQRSPEHAWEQFLDLWESGRKMGLQPTQYQQEQKRLAQIRYYESVQKLEAWRKARDRTTAINSP
jgi:hypothetical protein